MDRFPAQPGLKEEPCLVLHYGLPAHDFMFLFRHQYLQQVKSPTNLHAVLPASLLSLILKCSLSLGSETTGPAGVRATHTLWNDFFGSSTYLVNPPGPWIDAFDILWNGLPRATNRQRPFTRIRIPPPCPGGSDRSGNNGWWTPGHTESGKQAGPGG